MYLSASSISCLMRCPREYIYKYKLKIEEPKSAALIWGSLFHAALENPEVLSNDEIYKNRSAGLDHVKYPYREITERMVYSHKQATAHLPPVKHHEVPLSVTLRLSPILGYIDGVRVGANGGWYISETKSTSKLNDARRASFTSEIQVMTYMSNYEAIGDELGLHPGKFLGMTYEITQKPTVKPRKNENHFSFIERAAVKTEVWTVPPMDANTMRPVLLETISLAKDIRDRAESIFLKTATPKQVPGNTQSCERYGQRCGYFHLCHGNAGPEPEEQDDAV